MQCVLAAKRGYVESHHRSWREEKGGCYLLEMLPQQILSKEKETVVLPMGLEESKMFTAYDFTLLVF